MKQQQQPPQRLWLLGCFAVAALTACGNDNGIEVTGYLEESSIEITSLDPITDVADVTLRVLGRPGAASNSGSVIALNIRTDEHVTVDVGETGSFVLDIAARQADTIRLRHSDNDEQLVDVEVEPLTDFPVIDNLLVTVPNFEGIAGVEVRFQGDLGDRTVVVSNFNNHHVTDLHQWDQDPLVHFGGIPAVSGDFLILHVFAGDGAHSLGVEAQVP